MGLRGILGLVAIFGSASTLAAGMPPIQTVFVIMMENYDWSSIKGNTNAPFINGTLLPMASHCEQYYNPPGLHPSEPNYLWLEAGTNFGIFNDSDPSVNHQNTTNHLVTLLNAAGISWKAYQEDISGTVVPLVSVGNYGVWHDPFVFFDDVTGTNNPSYPYGLAHIRPYSELAADLTNNTVARYNFITPNLCDDMHYACSPLNNAIRQGDNWLAAAVPMILASKAYQNRGALFIIWDEGATADGPIGMIVLSPLARGNGYWNQIYYTHSSTLRTLQEIFGVTPLLGDAANASNLADLFIPFGPFNFSAVARLGGGGIQLTATGAIPGTTNLLLASTDLRAWMTVNTNLAQTNTLTVTDYSATNFGSRFYRLMRLP